MQSSVLTKLGLYERNTCTQAAGYNEQYDQDVYKTDYNQTTNLQQKKKQKKNLNMHGTLVTSVININIIHTLTHIFNNIKTMYAVAYASLRNSCVSVVSLRRVWVLP